jgi:hypothetical protein
MGLKIDRDEFEESEFAEFGARLQRELQALAAVLERPRFGQGPLSIGAELELNLVGTDAGPAIVNHQVLAAAADARLSLEANRFNLEINAPPSKLAGFPFSALHGELADALRITRQAAEPLGARVALIGILPTLEPGDLQPQVLSDAHRYRALANGLRRIRGEPFKVDIRGFERLTSAAHEVTFEGANTSLQVHLRVPPEDFAHTYNAAQLATAVVLACSSNAPFFLGKRLWHETRVALFRQSVDDRAAGDDDWRSARVSFGHGWVRQGAHELFEESVALHEPLLPMKSKEDCLAIVAAGNTPSLAELRLHHGTVWRWNRAIYDPVDGGHLRIEMRALPAGPTLRDTVSNAAFLVGLALGLAPRMAKDVCRITFGQARRNFYEAARSGLDAELLWPRAPAPSPEPQRARDLAEMLLPVARDGLTSHGVDAREADEWLAAIEGRLRVGQTGSVWQLAEFEHHRRRGSAVRARRAMLTRYMDLSEEEAPVHEWPRNRVAWGVKPLALALRGKGRFRDEQPGSRRI